MRAGLARRALVGLSLAYALSALLALLLEAVLLHCHERDGVVRGAGEDVWLTSNDGVRLQARYYARDPSLPALLYFHGSAGTLASRSDRLELFASLGASLLAVEYRGYGASGGTSSERGFQRDARAAYAWLRQTTPAAPVVPFGESMGGGVASWLARTEQVGGLILLSTPTSTPDVFRSFMPWLTTELLVHTKLDSLSHVAHVRAPKLFIHSRDDGVVPFRMAEALWAAAPQPKRKLWLEHIGHNDTFYAARTKACTAIRAFLRDDVR